jgi:hypothetical protein
VPDWSFRSDGGMQLALFGPLTIGLNGISWFRTAAEKFGHRLVATSFSVIPT